MKKRKREHDIVNPSIQDSDQECVNKSIWYLLKNFAAGIVEEIVDESIKLLLSKI